MSSNSFNKIALRPADEGANKLIDRIIAARPDLAGASFVVPEYGRPSQTVMTMDEVFKSAHNPAWPDEIRRECGLLQAVAGRDLGVRVPQVTMVAADESFYAMQRLRGMPLTRECLDVLPDEERLDIARRIGVFNARLARCEGGGRIAASAVTAEKMAAVFGNDDFWDETGCDLRELSRLENFMKTYSLMPPMLMHGDMHQGNILYDQDTASLSLIDLGNGDTVSAAHAFSVLRIYYPADFVDAALQGFCAESGMTVNPAELDLYKSMQELLAISQVRPAQAAALWKQRVRPKLSAALDSLEEVQPSTAQSTGAKPFAAR